MILGEVFAGGQLLNNPHPSMVGRQCAKQTQKDKNLLAGLGVVTLPAPSNVHCKNKVDRLLADTPGKQSWIGSLMRKIIKQHFYKERLIR